MEIALISLAAFLASLLTLFSGFGLGTLLMPVVALFFPLPLAVAMTALVHLANNLFKLGLLGRQASVPVLLRFGLPAVALAFPGAWLLTRLGEMAPWLEYRLLGRDLSVTPIDSLIGALIVFFVILELSPAAERARIHPRWLPLGGAISGFFGGLSGHQGAFRSMFLLKAGLDKEAFIATGVVLAVMVDLARMLVYGVGLLDQAATVNWPVVMAATLSAFVGAFAGRRLLNKVTLRFVRVAVSILLMLIAVGLITGLI